MCDNIKVAVRVRPLIQRELTKGDKIRWLVENNTVFHIDDDGQKTSEYYNFDHIFNEKVRNDHIYQTLGKPLVETAVKGINATIFAYGQTSSGKTFTMMGSKDEMGFIALAVKDMFNMINQTTSRKFLIRTSYIEIYNEKIHDLLNKEAKDIKLREDFTGNVIVHVTEKISTTSDEVLSVMTKGEKNRQIGETNMNERSSRSHTIFRIIIESSEIDIENAPVQVSQLNFVDLAGSERISQTKASGVRLKEGSHINKSLTVLGLVIRQLSDGADFVNFRDSKLTRMLQQSLGGNAKTVIVAAITPVSVENGQTTLAFAQRAKTIKNKPQVNEILTDTALMKQYEIKMSNLKKELSKQYSVNKNLETDKERKDRIITELTERIHMLQKTFVIAKKPVSVKGRRHTIAQPSGFHLKPVPEGLNILENDLPFISETPLDQFELDLIEAEKERHSTSIGLSDNKIIKHENKVTERRCATTLIPKKFISRCKLAEEQEAQRVAAKEKSEPVKEDVETRVNGNVPAESPGTPKGVLRSRLRALENELHELQDFTRLETQLKNEETMDGLRSQLRELLSKHTDLQKAYNDVLLKEKAQSDLIQELEKQIKDEIEKGKQQADKFNEQIKNLKKQLEESSKAAEEIEKKFKNQCESLEQALVEKDFIFEQKEKKLKSRIEELLASIANKSPEKKETPKIEINESIIIAPTHTDVYLQESLDRITVLEERIRELEMKENEYCEQINNLSQKLLETGNSFGCDTEELESIQSGLKVLENLLSSSKPRRNSLFAGNRSMKNDNVNSLMEEIIRMPYKRIEHLERDKISYEQEISNLNSSLIDKTEDFKILEEKYSSLLKERNDSELQTKLESDTDNIIHLNQEINRLQSEMKSLQEELERKNERISKLTKDLNNIEGINSDSLEGNVQYCTELNAENEDLKLNIRQKEIEIHSMTAQLSSLEEKICELVKLEEKVIELQDVNKKQMNEIKELLSENDIFKNDNEALNDELQNAEKVIEEQKLVIQNLEDAINSKTDEVNNVLGQLQIFQESEGKAEELRNSVTMKEKQISNNLELIQRLESTINEHINDKSKFDALIEAKEAEIKTLSQEIISLNKEKADQEEKLKSENAKLLESLENENAKLLESLENEKTKIQERENEFKELQKSVMIKTDELNKMKTENVSLNELMNEKSDLETLLECKEIEIEDLHNEIKSLKDNDKAAQLQIIVAEKNEEINQLNLKIGNLSEEISILKEKQDEQDKMQKVVCDKDAEISKLVEESNNLEKLIAEKTNKMEELNNEISNLKNILEQKDKQILESSETITKLQKELDNVQSKARISIDQFDSEMKNNNEQINRLQKEIEKMTPLAEEHAFLTQEIGKLRGANEDLYKKMENTSTIISEKDEFANKLKRDIAEKEDSILALQKQVEEHEKLIKETNEMKSKVENEQMDLNNFKIKCKKLETIIAEKESANKLLNSKINDFQQRMKEKIEQFDALQDELKYAKSSIDRRNTNINVMQEKIDKLISEKQANEVKLVASLKTMDELKNNLQAMESSKNNMTIKVELKAELSDKDKEISNLKQKIDELNGLIQLEQTSTKKLQSELQEKNCEHGKLKGEIKYLKSELQSLRDIINKQNMKIKDFTNMMDNDKTKKNEFNSCQLQLLNKVNIIECLKCNKQCNKDIIPKEVLNRSLDNCLVDALNNCFKCYTEQIISLKKDSNKGINATSNYWQNMYNLIVQSLESETGHIKKYISTLDKNIPSIGDESSLDLLWSETKQSPIDNLRTELKQLKHYLSFYMKKCSELNVKCQKIDKYEDELQRLKETELKLNDTNNVLVAKLNGEQTKVAELRSKYNIKAGELEKINNNMKSVVQSRTQLLDENEQVKRCLQNLKDELSNYRTQGCIKCGNVPFALGQDENVNTCNIMGLNRPSDVHVNEQTRKVYQENKELKEKIRDMEREWKGNTAVEKIRKERRQSLQNANRSLIENCQECDLLKIEKGKLEKLQQQCMKENYDLMTKVNELNKKLKSSTLTMKTPETIEHYQSLVKNLEKKLREQGKRRSCDKCLYIKTREMQDQSVQVSQIDLSQEVTRKLEKEIKELTKKYEETKKIARQRAQQLQEMEKKMKK